MARLAVVRFHHFERLRQRLVELGVDPEAAMEPFVTAIDAFHERTAPSTWLEGLVKAYVGDGISSDFYREISAYVDPVTRDLVAVVLKDVGQAEFVVREVRAAIGLASLLVGSVDRPGADLADLVRMFGRITEEHSRRMGRLGLSA
jgi:hypothetical protein